MIINQKLRQKCFYEKRIDLALVVNGIRGSQGASISLEQNLGF